MATSFLTTKLFVPRLRPKVVQRPRLIEQLNAGLYRKLTLISAQAGFGKTTIVTEWLSQIDYPIAWVSLDEDDSDAQQFFTYVAAAIRPFSADQQTLADLLQAPQPQPAKALAMALINDCMAISSPCVLVLDDYHEVESAEIDLALTFLLDHMPPNLRLVTTSRSDPGFPLSRLRARNQLTEIRANELRFSTEETAFFLQSVMGVTLSPKQISALEARTEGWVAGLQMAALSMQNRDDVAEFVSSFTGSHRFIMDYLVEEVLNQQSIEVQDFLLKTAVLTTLCADLCDALRQSSTNSQQILEQLETHNIFLIPLDNERRWYRYHHLFADLLRSRLAQGQPDWVPQLHQRASDWYAENGHSNDAIRHALAANDFERAARQMELVWSVTHTHRSYPWWKWLDLLPDSVVRLRPVLIVSGAWAHLIFDSDRDACERRLQEAEQWLKRSEAEREALGMVVVDEEKFKMLPVIIASARAIAALEANDTVSAIKHARQALDLLPEENHLGRNLPEPILGLSYFANGELESAYETLSNAFNSAYRSGNMITAISMKSLLTDIQMVQGRLHDARQTCEQALQLVVSAQGDLNLWGTANLLLSLSEIHRQKGDLKTAADFWQQSDSLGKQASNATYQYRRRLALADIKASQGAFDEALHLLDQAAPWLDHVHLTETRTLAALKAQVWIKQGQLDKAMAWVNQQGLAIDDKLSYLHEFDYMVMARLRIAQYQNGFGDDAIHQAIRLLARLLQAAKTGKRYGSLIEILILQTLAQEAQDDIASAIPSLTEALTLAQPQGYVRLFVDEGLPVQQLLQQLKPENPGQKAFCHKLLAAFDSASSEPVKSQPLVDPLSRRELEILSLIAAGLKNKEIAAELFISLNTVLFHIKNIYGKLGVNKRTLAIAKAKELGLI